MPIYEYKRPDGSTFDVMQSFSEDPLTHDPETGVEVQRVLHAPAVHFKGSGFYNTDYGTRRRQRENAASGEGSSESKKDSAESSSGAKDAKAEPSGEKPAAAKSEPKAKPEAAKSAVGASQS
jgi:putative FmdB family regulatory protein